MSNYISNQSFIRPPQEFICPVSQQLMRDPVTASDGQTYDRGNY